MREVEVFTECVIEQRDIFIRFDDEVAQGDVAVEVGGVASAGEDSCTADDAAAFHTEVASAEDECDGWDEAPVFEVDLGGHVSGNHGGGGSNLCIAHGDISSVVVIDPVEVSPVDEDVLAVTAGEGVPTIDGDAIPVGDVGAVAVQEIVAKAVVGSSGNPRLVHRDIAAASDADQGRYQAVPVDAGYPQIVQRDVAAGNGDGSTVADQVGFVEFVCGRYIDLEAVDGEGRLRRRVGDRHPDFQPQNQAVLCAVFVFEMVCAFVFRR